MGGDSRLFGPIQLSNINLLTPDHVEPLPGEDLRRYAARLISEFEIAPQDVIGGASFGGMLAAEISTQCQVAGLVLLGSCLQPSRLPWSYRWMERAGWLIPDFALGVRSWMPLVRWRFAPTTPEAGACLIAMAADYPTSQIRAFGRMALGWPGISRPSCPTLSVHGDQDRIIPLRCADPDVVLTGAGHAFTLTHSAQTIAAIQGFLNRL